jgi:hypothetical protein
MRRETETSQMGLRLAQRLGYRFGEPAGWETGVGVVEAAISFRREPHQTDRQIDSRVETANSQSKSVHLPGRPTPSRQRGEKMLPGVRGC